MKTLTLLLSLTLLSCIKEQEIKPVDKWWLKECTNKYLVTPEETTYRFCWNIKLKCNELEKEVQRCFYTNCEIIAVVQRDYSDCEVLNISKI